MGAVFGLAAMLGACSLLEPDGEEYLVTAILGAPPPVTVIYAAADDGTVLEVQILGGTVRLLPFARYEQRLRARRLWNGVAYDTAMFPVTVSGRYVRDGPVLSVLYREPVFHRETGRQYEFLDDWRILRGIESFNGFGAFTVEYVRQ